jgi:predicted RNA-binding Zn ribbon-like protein
MADPEFVLLGDATWLDFINTVPAVPSAVDSLPDAAAYHRWTKALKLAPDPASTSFDSVRRLRTRLHQLARLLDEDRAPSSAITQTINEILTRVEGRQQLVRVGGTWRLRFHPLRPASALEAVAVSASETLATPIAQVRRCSAPDCGLYFTDLTPQQGRRWCSFKRCGHRGRVERRRASRVTPLV